MTTKRLTQTHVERQRPPADKPNAIIWDRDLRGFAMRINQNKKSWVIQTRIHGKQISYSFADTGEMGLAEARDEARRLLRLAKNGTHPKDEKRLKQEAQKAKEQTAYSFRDLVADYLASPVGLDGRKHSKNYIAMNRWMLSDVLKVAAFADLPVDSITRRMLIDFGDAIPAGTRGAINRAKKLAVINRMFSWGVEKEKIATNPLLANGRKFKVPVQAAIRDRALGFRVAGQDQLFVPDEITAFWNAAEQLGHPLSGMLRMLLLTGARLREVSDLVWSEIDLPGKVWRLPGERTKNSRGHNIPLSPLAMDILSNMPMIGRSPFVFTTTGAGPVSGFSNAKSRIDKLLGADIPEWRFHDLRRSCASLMQMLGVDYRVIEACLNHQSGTKAGLIGRYQRFEFSDAKRPAFDRLSFFLSGLLAGEEANALIRRLTATGSPEIRSGSAAPAPSFVPDPDRGRSPQLPLVAA